MKRQRGFTLVELVIAIAITGIIVPFLGVAIYQILNVTDYGSRETTATHELQNAASWFSGDVTRSNAVATEAQTLTISIPPDTNITYTLEGTELKRTSGADTVTVARNITSVDYTISGRLVSMVLTSQPEGQSEVSKTGTYQVYMRVAP